MAAKRRFVGLDGLKGIALIAIVLYHCDELSLQGGFFGVDVFFTISGFLIFSSLLNRIDSGKGLELGEYFLKRFRRAVCSYPDLGDVGMAGEPRHACRHPEPDHDRASGMLQLVCHQQRSQLFLPDEP